MSRATTDTDTTHTWAGRVAIRAAKATARADRLAERAEQAKQAAERAERAAEDAALDAAAWILRAEQVKRDAMAGTR